jgi:hypothetical protein
MKPANKSVEVPDAHYFFSQWLLPAHLIVSLRAKDSHSCNVQIDNSVYYTGMTINTTITDHSTYQQPWKEAIYTRIRSDMGKS